MTALRSKKSRIRAAGPAGVSWVALVAATALGVAGVQRVRAAVSADPKELGESREGYRLIVQSYAPSSLGSGQLPGGRTRPLASTQRSVTREELSRGISIDMLGLEASVASSPEAPVIIAWVETGRPDLDFDGFEARPAADAFYGIATSTATATPVVLKKHG